MTNLKNSEIKERRNKIYTSITNTPRSLTSYFNKVKEDEDSSLVVELPLFTNFSLFQYKAFEERGNINVKGDVETINYLLEKDAFFLREGYTSNFSSEAMLSLLRYLRNKKKMPIRIYNIPMEYRENIEKKDLEKFYSFDKHFYKLMEKMKNSINKGELDRVKGIFNELKDVSNKLIRNFFLTIEHSKRENKNVIAFINMLFEHLLISLKDSNGELKKIGDEISLTKDSPFIPINSTSSLNPIYLHLAFKHFEKDEEKALKLFELSLKNEEGKRIKNRFNIIIKRDSFYNEVEFNEKEGKIKFFEGLNINFISYDDLEDLIIRIIGEREKIDGVEEINLKIINSIREMKRMV